MLVLVAGLVLFLGVHLLPAQVELRRELTARFGPGPYKLGFVAVSAIGLALIVYGYGKVQMLPGKNPQLWIPPIWSKHVAFTLMLPALVLLVSAYVPSRLRTAVGHPMLAAIMLWAVAHLISNGMLADVLLFGSFLVWAIYDRVSVQRRNASGPLGKKTGTLTGDVIALAGGLALYLLLLFWGHAKLTGVALVP